MSFHNLCDEGLWGFALKVAKKCCSPTKGEELNCYNIQMCSVALCLEFNETFVNNSIYLYPCKDDDSNWNL